MQIKFIHPADVENLIRLYAEKRIYGNALAVGVVLAAYAGQDGIAHPSRSRLATDTGLSLTRISAATNELAAAGWMSTAKGNRNANVYIVNRVQYPTPFEPEQECVDQSYKRTSPISGLVLQADQTSPISGHLLIHYMKEYIKEESMHTHNDHTDTQTQDIASGTDTPDRPQTGPQGDADGRTGTPAPAETTESHQEPKKRASGKSKKRAPAEKVLMTDTGFVIPESKRTQWKETLPGINDYAIDTVAQELYATCKEEPGKYTDFTKALFNWVKREYRRIRSREPRHSQQEQKAKSWQETVDSKKYNNSIRKTCA